MIPVQKLLSEFRQDAFKLYDTFLSEMAMNGSGIRDTARVLKISSTTVIEALKKDRHLKAINEARLAKIELT